MGTKTAESCWLCDRERGELCHVHEQLDPKEPETVWIQAESDDEAIDQA